MTLTTNDYLTLLYIVEKTVNKLKPDDGEERLKLQALCIKLRRNFYKEQILEGKRVDRFVKRWNSINKVNSEDSKIG